MQPICISRCHGDILGPFPCSRRVCHAWNPANKPAAGRNKRQTGISWRHVGQDDWRLAGVHGVFSIVTLGLLTMSRRIPLPPESLSADSTKLYEVLNDGTDASVIIIGVSYIDACLASLLAKRLRKSSVTEKLLDSRSGAVGSFVARSDLAYTLALIDKPMYQELLVLAKLRNEIAHHHFELSFNSEAVIRLCNDLEYVAGLKNGNTGGPLMEDTWLAHARDRFTLTATMIVNRLLLTALGTVHVEQ